MAGELTNLLIGVLLFGMFFTGITVFYGDMSSSYNVTTTDVSNISQSNSFTTKAQQIKDSVQQNTEEGGSSDMGVTGFLLPLQLILGSFDALGALVTGGIEALNDSGVPVPTYVGSGLIAIIAVFISLAILGAVIKREI